VPTPVITASLYARFRSRGNGDFSDRVLAALRNQFGGHAVKSAPGTAPSASLFGNGPMKKSARSKPSGVMPKPAGRRAGR
jgi:6-phosphogluconate dehydrogenase